MTQLRLLDLAADRMEGEVVAAFFFRDVRPLRGPAALLDWRLGDPLTLALVAGSSEGRAGEQVLVRNNGKLASEWALFVGGGDWHGLGPQTYRSLIVHLLQACHGAGFERIALCLVPLPEQTTADVEAMVGAAVASLDSRRGDCLLSLENLD